MSTSLSFNSYSEVQLYLHSLPKFSTSGVRAANFNLERMVKFCAEIGNPQNKFPIIHVAGTNGKGTTCQMLASIFQTAGYKTALYTSPHLLDVRERFKIDSKNIEPETLLKFFRKYGGSVQKSELTFFELTTAIAFWYFSEERVDIALIETGLGGRLDATNIVNPIVSVITSVDLDHTDLLGNTIEKIAAEKAGIIKPGVPVVTGRLPEAAKSVIIDAADNLGAAYHSAENFEPLYENGSIKLHTNKETLSVKAPNRKKIDSVNAAVSYSVLKILENTFRITDSEFVSGIEKTDQYFPHHAHFEKLSPNKNWYFDGAHNLEAMKLLVGELLDRAPAREWTVVLSFMKDKLVPDLTEIWKPFPDVKLFEMQSERAATFSEMKQIFPYGSKIYEDDILNPEEGIKSELVIFSGSFYFYEKVRRWMGTIATYDD